MLETDWPPGCLKQLHYLLESAELPPGIIRIFFISSCKVSEGTSNTYIIQIIKVSQNRRDIFFEKTGSPKSGVKFEVDLSFLSCS